MWNKQNLLQIPEMLVHSKTLSLFKNPSLFILAGQAISPSVKGVHLIVMGYLRWK